MRHARREGSELAGAFDRSELPAARGVKLDLPVGQREEGVVGALADALAGMDPGPPLADDHAPGRDLLAAERLHAETLGLGVPAVLGGAAALLVCHRAKRVT